MSKEWELIRDGDASGRHNSFTGWDQGPWPSVGDDENYADASWQPSREVVDEPLTIPIETMARLLNRPCDGWTFTCTESEHQLMHFCGHRASVARGGLDVLGSHRAVMDAHRCRLAEGEVA